MRNHNKYFKIAINTKKTETKLTHAPNTDDPDADDDNDDDGPYDTYSDAVSI